MIDRRRVLKLMGAGGTAAGLLPLLPGARRSRAASLTPLNVGVGGITFAYLPLFAAKAAGFFEEEGLDITIVNANGGTNALAAALGGSVDVCGLVMSDMILAAAKGQKLQAFAPLMSQYASDAVISIAAAKKAGITSDMPLKDRMARLKGMTLAISGRGSGTDKLWRYLVGLGGLDPDTDVTLTVVKLDQMYSAVVSGQIDGFNTTAPANNRAVQDGKTIWVAKPSQGEVPGLENFLYTVLGAKSGYLAKNPHTAAKLVRGLSKGAALIHADPEQAGKAMHDVFFAQSDVSLIVDTVRDQMATVASPPQLTQAQFQQNVDFMKRFGDEINGVEMADVMNREWVSG